ncbi:MAG TPA: sulfite exporter TauE/SafE family protein [Acidobacteriota bacterium]|nr:sulfite exporter TauE/SafE family protein [Acidobacteriota bacterium]
MIATGFELVLLLVGAFVGALVTAVCGFGGGILILPLIVAIVGPRAAVPLITFMLVFSNATRLLLLRRWVDWPLALRYTAGAVPAAVLGGILFVRLPAGFITRGIGVFLILSVILNRWNRVRLPHRHQWIFYPAGALVGFFSAIWGAIGPLAVPFFLAARLGKEAFVGTLAFGALVMHIAKTVTYGRFDLLSDELVRTGLILGALMIAGAWTGTRILHRTDPRIFRIAVDILLVIVGVIFLVQ